MKKQPDQEDKFIFHGTLMEGPEIDLIELSGLNLTEQEEDKIWEEWNAREMLMETLIVDEIEINSADSIPGQSDSWYEYRCSSKSELGIALKGIILSTLDVAK